VLNTTYGEIARHVIWGDAAIRDITNWMETCKKTQVLIEYVRKKGKSNADVSYKYLCFAAVYK